MNKLSVVSILILLGLAAAGSFLVVVHNPFNGSLSASHVSAPPSQANNLVGNANGQPSNSTGSLLTNPPQNTTGQDDGSNDGPLDG